MQSPPATTPLYFSKVLVWDAPTRVCHWLLAVCFAGAYWTADQDDWEAVHATLGYTTCGLAIFRIVWGFIGTRYVRFYGSIQGPAAIARYMVQMQHGWGKRYIGYSPLSAMIVPAFLLLVLVLGATGWMVFSAQSSASIARFHESAAYTTLVFVGLHIVCVVFSSWRSGENLLLAMVTGTKLGAPSEAIDRTWRSVALLIVAAVAVFWVLK
ncbi:cytochrome b/b6 domain-containing protein [Variovorax sp. HJSM1_2]|uniref:cytochrome b/b6 domain-containing protein n=1 Tax=Variovorax sp. HJSM1_2 TaxID=3366263 RepID=UPI003BD06316